ncbi:hypothetical protein B0A49_04016 [Cryomyces minteri]|uniref:Major facilitator superfamily (MFS) profile domain-containing protein n=1 Tax=Cryomyces minteri TaxID=331657 RepID=A0A4U0XFJ1_9PEZI|nr:hypothetical protein B0A49_04016 [Cryomyces minteri]
MEAVSRAYQQAAKPALRLQCCQPQLPLVVCGSRIPLQDHELVFQTLEPIFRSASSARPVRLGSRLQHATRDAPATASVAKDAFGYIEARAVSPILPIHAINGTVGYVLACVGVGWGSFGIWVFYSWRWLEEIRHDTPLSVSAQYAPAVLCGLIAAGFTGFMLTHTPVSFVMMIAMFAFMVGHVIAGTMPAHQVYWAQFFFSIIIMPFGMDMSFPAATVILSNHMPREHQGLAASLVNTVVNYSISIALGIAGTVETSVNHRSSNPADIERGIRAAYYTGIALSVSGVVLGGVFFARTMLKEGWKIMDH